MTEFAVAGIGLWTPGLPDWPAARAVLTGAAAWPEAAGGRPTPSLMPANERRRAPDSVLMALTVAEQACAAAGADPATVASVFASVFGDLAINDYMCATLRDDPAQMSPTKFHNSVHNAPSGYWSIATGAMAAATSLAAGRETFAAALHEAVVQLADSGEPVLLVAYDAAGCGPVGAVAGCRASFACALLLSPDTAGAHGPRLRAATATTGAASAVPDALAALAADNPIAAGAAPLLALLAGQAAGPVRAPLSPALDLVLDRLP